MQNKQNKGNSKSKSWTDVQLIISSVAIASTLGFWSVFAAPQKKIAGVTGEVIVPPSPDTNTSNSVILQPQLVPGQKLLFGGTAPKPQVVYRSGGGGGGGGGGAAAGGGGGGAAPSGGGTASS